MNVYRRKTVRAAMALVGPFSLPDCCATARGGTVLSLSDKVISLGCQQWVLVNNVKWFFLCKVLLGAVGSWQ